HREDRAELEVEKERRIAGEPQLGPKAPIEQSRPADRREDGEDAERSGGAAGDDVHRKDARRGHPVAPPDDAADQERRADERVHSFVRYQRERRPAKGTAIDPSSLTKARRTSGNPRPRSNIPLKKRRISGRKKGASAVHQAPEMRRTSGWPRRQ